MLFVLSGGDLLVKRCFDILIAVPVLVLTSPLLCLLALAIKLDSPGPLLHRASRVGKGGRCFLLLKFRSMIVNALQNGPAITRSGDPRITRLGRFLRKTKIDELPQFINVVKGEMSIIGPRPEDPRYVAYYTSEQRQVLSVRPGITSPASIKYRDEEQLLANANVDLETAYVTMVLPDKLRIDLEYVHNHSLWLDLSLIFQTVLSLFSFGRRIL
jgi:lipopolysaccharide/colanic/teichoic acid biosynthesis glycosyltransferase